MRFSRFGAASAAWVVAAAAAASANAQDSAPPGAADKAEITAPSAPVQNASPPGGDTASTQAETDAAAAGDEIIVTAQRREESAQRVPISLTVLSGAALDKANIVNVQDIGRVAPSFYAYRAPQAANTRLSIRGIGSSGNTAIEPSVGAFVDGIYIPRPGPLLAGLNDIASVEVLRGPQGTLFGRNASVGAISFHTVEPRDELEAQLTGEVGNYGRAKVNGIINLPVNEKIATRFSILYDSFDGYGRNRLFNNARFGQNDTLSLRGAVRTSLTENLTWLLRGDYQHQRGDGQAVVTVDAATVTPAGAANFATRLNGLTPRLDATHSYTVNQITTGRLKDDQWGLSSDLALDAGGFTVRLLSGYRDWDNRQTERDISLTAADLYGRNATYRSKSHSEELQLISPTDLLDNHLNFVGGLYYFREDYEIGTILNLAPGYCNVFIRNVRPAQLTACLAGPQSGVGNAGFDQVTESYAGYGQATFKITDQWDVTGGLRYSHDDKTGGLLSTLTNTAAAGLTAPDRAALSFSGGKVTYRLNTTYRPIEDVMLFATVSTGYKSGGFDAGTGNTLGNARVFAPETTINYEIGWKTETFGRRLTINGTMFRMNIDDFQLRSYNGLFFSVRNAGSIRQQGIEFDITGRPTRDLSLGLSATRLASEYTDFRNAPGLPAFGGVQDLTGKRVSFSPKWQGTASADYRTKLSDDYALGFNTRLAFISDIDIGGAGDANPQGIQQGYALLGGRISLYGPAERWEIALSGENLTDQGYCTLKYAQTLGAALGLNNTATGGTTQRCVLGEPRTVRLSGKIRF